MKLHSGEDVYIGDMIIYNADHYLYGTFMILSSTEMFHWSKYLSWRIEKFHLEYINTNNLKCEIIQ
jgi:hypothetical protein